MEFLILAHPDDETALRVGAVLRRRHGREAVGIISAEALAMAPRIVHTLSSAPGQPNLAIETAITLAGGVELLSGQIGVVFNRLRASDAPHFNASAAADREYASAETGALWVSWLAGLQSRGVAVINPVWRGAQQVGFSQLEWLKLASQAGLPVGETRVSAAEMQAGAPSTAPQAMQRWLAAGSRLMRMDLPAMTTPAALAAENPPWRAYKGDAVERLPAAFAALPQKIASLQAASACELLELFFTDPANPASGEMEDVRLASVSPFPHLPEPEATLALAQMLEEAAR